MAKHHEVVISDERFDFSDGIKKTIFIIGGVGLALLIVGCILAAFTGGGHEEAQAATHAAAEHTEATHTGAASTGEGITEHGGSGTEHSEFHWYDRLYASLWINNVYFTGLAIIGVFFLAIQYAAQAGWSAGIKRVMEAFGAWLPYAGVLMLVTFIIANHTIFHWTHGYLYVEGTPEYDAIIAGKRAYLNTPFFLIRLVAYFALWYWMYRLIRRESLAEDINGGTAHYYKMIKYSTIFIIIFAVTSSTSAWDWILSIDTHWFSTMIGWYVFASWFAAGLAAITLLVVRLRENGYLMVVGSEHLHDLGKFVFAFSIFWTYIWLGQYLLIYYANIPEESIYFVERLSSDYYRPIFYMILVLNFAIPFLVLMTRDSKRLTIFLKVVCSIVLVGHWFDFYLLVTPGTLAENGAFGLLEIGCAMVYLAGFVFVVLGALAKAPLIAKNHPMLEESIHHHT